MTKEGMTIEEAIVIIENEKPQCGRRITFPEEERCEAYDIAIAALKAELCDNAISRDAVDELSKELVHTTRNKADFLCNFWEGLQKLLPVTSTFPTCDDAVSREAVKSALCELCGDKNSCPFVNGDCDDLKAIEALPPVTPKPMECKDCVSREAVLNYIRDNYRRWFINDDAFMQCVNGIKDFISVTPKPTECEDAVSRTDLLDAIYDLDAAFDDNFELDYGRCYKTDLDKMAMELPPVTPKQRTGKWIIDGHHRRCSICENSFCVKDREGDMIADNFCPNCGAKMEGESE